MVETGDALEGERVALTCAVCGKSLQHQNPYQDEAGNVRCADCAPQAAAECCEGCGRNLRGERSYLRTDGALLCGRCFAPAEAADDGRLAGRAERASATGRSKSPASGTSQIDAGEEGPTLRETSAITDVPEPGLGWGAAAAAAVAGIVAGVFTESLAVALVVGPLVFGAHWLLMRVSDE